MSLSQTALLLIDLQIGLISHPTYWGSPRSNLALEQNVERLLSHFRSVRAMDGSSPLIIHVFHHSIHPLSPLYPSSPGVKPMPALTPLEQERVFTKNVNSAFIGTNLEAYIREMQITKLFVVRMTTDQCISTSVRMAANLGVVDYGNEKGQIVLVGDGCATFNRGKWDAETVHAVNVESLRGEFCEVMSTKEALDAMKA
ncbi:hypothetical protein FRB94_003932 [Tulasnella sp. JGI-2019a]|nr:hypothetical protein FRB94_003932 [Tulasnella sp. JGI-2019a]